MEQNIHDPERLDKRSCEYVILSWWKEVLHSTELFQVPFSDKNIVEGGGDKIIAAKPSWVTMSWSLPCTFYVLTTLILTTTEWSRDCYPHHCVNEEMEA